MTLWPYTGALWNSYLHCNSHLLLYPLQKGLGLVKDWGSSWAHQSTSTHILEEFGLLYAVLCQICFGWPHGDSGGLQLLQFEYLLIQFFIQCISFGGFCEGCIVLLVFQGKCSHPESGNDTSLEISNLFWSRVLSWELSWLFLLHSRTK